MIDLDRITDQTPSCMGKTVDLLRQLREAGEPVLLAVNGKGNLPVLDETSYQQLLALVDRLEVVEMLKERLKGPTEAQHFLSLEEAKEEVRKKYGISV